VRFALDFSCSTLFSCSFCFQCCSVLVCPVFPYFDPCAYCDLSPSTLVMLHSSLGLARGSLTDLIHVGRRYLPTQFPSAYVFLFPVPPCRVDRPSFGRLSLSCLPFLPSSGYGGAPDAQYFLSLHSVSYDYALLFRVPSRILNSLFDISSFA